MKKDTYAFGFVAAEGALKDEAEALHELGDKVGKAIDVGEGLCAHRLRELCQQWAHEWTDAV